MTTALDIITDAMQLISVVGANDTLEAADEQLGLRMLNRMMDMWSNFSLICYEILEQSATLIPGQGAYTIGPGGNFNMTRPLSILGDPGSAYTLDPNGNRYPLSVIPRDKWNLFGNVSPLIQGNFPNALFYDPQFPLGVINLVPVPNIAYTLYFDSMLQLVDFTSPQQLLSLPPGYEMAMVYNLAILLNPFFLDGKLPQEVIDTAATALGAIKRTNRREMNAIFESEIVSRASVNYNPYTDSPGNAVR